MPVIIQLSFELVWYSRFLINVISLESEYFGKSQPSTWWSKLPFYIMVLHSIGVAQWFIGINLWFNIWIIKKPPNGGFWLPLLFKVATQFSLLTDYLLVVRNVRKLPLILKEVDWWFLGFKNLDISIKTVETHLTKAFKILRKKFRSKFHVFLLLLMNKYDKIWGNSDDNLQNYPL